MLRYTIHKASLRASLTFTPGIEPDLDQIDGIILIDGAAGSTARETAVKVNLSRRTIETRRERIVTLLGARNWTQAVFEAGRVGIVKQR